MAFKKNTAVTGFPFTLVNASDGSAITSGTVTGYYCLDGGSQSAINDSTPSHKGNGQWTVDLLAGEMNGDIVGLLFVHASAIPVHFTIKTVTKLASELNDVAATDIVSSGNVIDVTSGGCVGIDWANIENPTSAVDLSGTDIQLVDTCTTNTDMVGTDSALLAASAPTNFGDLAITASTGKVTVGTNDDKTGYDLNNDQGTVTVGTVTDVTNGVSLASAALTAASIADSGANRLADHTLRRSYNSARTGSYGDGVDFRSLLGAVAKLVNKIDASDGSSLIIYHEDGSTAFETSTITSSDSADPVTIVEPS